MRWISGSNRGAGALILSEITGPRGMATIQFVTSSARFVFEHYRWLLLTLPVYALLVYGVAAWPLAIVLAVAGILYNLVIAAANLLYADWLSRRTIYLRCLEIGMIGIGASMLYFQQSSFDSYRFYYDGFYGIFVALAAVHAGRKGTIWSSIAATLVVAVGQIAAAPALSTLLSPSAGDFWLSVVLYSGSFGIFFMAVGMLAGLSSDLRTHAGETTILQGIGQQFQALRDAVLVLKEDGTIVDANRAAADVFGAPVKLLRHSPVKQFIRFNSGSDEELTHATTPTRTRRPLVLTGVRSTGEEFPVEMTMSRYQSGEGGPAAAVAVIRDLTERNQMIQVAAQRERLATVGEVMARVIHELNSPLTGITTLVNDLIATSSTMDQGTLDMVLGEARRANSIVRELLTFVRHDNGAKNTASLNDAVEYAIRLSELRSDETDIMMVTDLSLDEPEAIAGSGKLQQIILNLVENARHAVQDREGGRVIVRTGSKDDSVYLEVADNGPGIPPSAMEEIFEPFFTTKEAGVGTGLGLAIVENIVSDMGGKIDIKSSTQGTTFRILLAAASAS